MRSENNLIPHFNEAAAGIPQLFCGEKPCPLCLRANLAAPYSPCSSRTTHRLPIIGQATSAAANRVCVTRATDWKNFQMQEEAEGRIVKSGYYDPLRNLGIALLANVLLALCSAFLQVTLGFVPAPWAVGTCLGFAGVSLGLLIFLWWQIAMNLVRWFAVIERKHSRTASASTPEKKKSAGPLL